ncbi:MAG: hypothetical protein R3B09_22275 [Nannocystaceae bacterium]
MAGGPADVATLALLAEHCGDLCAGPWAAIAEPGGPGSVLAPRDLMMGRARSLGERGLDVVCVVDEGEALTLLPVVGAGPEARWERPHCRAAPTLVEALRPLRIPGEPAVDEALFVMDPASDEPKALLERLLLLGRDDALICEFTAGDRTRFAVKVASPPIYLLMRARDGEIPGLQVFARSARAPLWVAWSYEHPLARVAVSGLLGHGQSALVDETGAWERLPQEWPTRSIYDVLAAELPAPRVTMTPTTTEARFRVTLRLAPGPVVDAELWLLAPERLLDLEPLIEASTGDELGRLTLARLTGAEGTVYVLRERVRPGAARMAARVSETLDLAGYARTPGADNLFLPSGRRLVPLLRRDELRALLRLDEAHTVILTEDADGPRIVTLAEVDESPLQRWIEYVATDRRLALDRLLERSIFEFPEATIVWPEAPDRPELQRPPPRERKADPRKRARIVVDEAPIEAVEESEDDLSARLRALRERAREIERVIAHGAVDDPDPWAELAATKVELDELDEAALCYESAIFHGGAPYDPALAAAAAALGARISGRDLGDDEALMELIVASSRTPSESAALGAAIVARISAGAPPLDEAMQLVLPLFCDPRLPVSRSLAWAVVAAWHRHARDRLGLTRAREAILGGLNERGLSELHDLPRFVRYALSLDDDDDADAPTSGDRPQQAQLIAVEALWRAAEEMGLPELDVHADYVRLVFSIGFGRLGARSSAHEIVRPIEDELDVHEPANRALFRLYMARLAHEASGSTAEAWADEVRRIIGSIADRKVQRSVLWLQGRSMWLRTEEPEARRPRVYQLPTGVDPADLAERLAREMARGSGNFDYVIAEAVEVCLARALATGSEALAAEVLGVAEQEIDKISILAHRAEAVGSCIRAAAAIEDDQVLGRLLDRLVDIARSPELGSVRELMHAVGRALVALRRFGGLEPARGLLEVLTGVTTQTASGTISLLATVAQGLVQLGDERQADDLLDRLLRQIFDGSFDYVSRAQAGIAVAGALRHWPNLTRIERSRRLLAEIHVFRDTFTHNRYYDTHKILVLEAMVDAVADSQTRQSDRIQGYLDLSEHALRRRIIADWSALCGR